jgi:hypothetical protein
VRDVGKECPTSGRLWRWAGSNRDFAAKVQLQERKGSGCKQQLLRIQSIVAFQT